MREVKEAQQKKNSSLAYPEKILWGILYNHNNPNLAPALVSGVVSLFSNDTEGAVPVERSLERVMKAESHVTISSQVKTNVSRVSHKPASQRKSKPMGVTSTPQPDERSILGTTKKNKIFSSTPSVTIQPGHGVTIYVKGITKSVPVDCKHSQKPENKHIGVSNTSTPGSHHASIKSSFGHKSKLHTSNKTASHHESKTRASNKTALGYKSNSHGSNKSAMHKELKRESSNKTALHRQSKTHASNQTSLGHASHKTALEHASNKPEHKSKAYASNRTPSPEERSGTRVFKYFTARNNTLQEANPFQTTTTSADDTTKKIHSNPTENKSPSGDGITKSSTDIDKKLKDQIKKRFLK